MRTPVVNLTRPLLWLLARAYFGIRFEGVGHVPLEGPLIIAPNHVTYADPPLVSIPLRRPIYYMAWRRLFEVPGLGWMIRRLRAFPVEVDAADRRATREAVRLLQVGAAMMIFPEGGRSADGRLQPFKAGAFRLAVSLGVPVLPVTIAGGHEAWPPKRLLPRPGRITIVYHPPIVPPQEPDLKTAAQELARRVRAAIASRLPPDQQPLCETGSGPS
ncbi:MAG: 1-acyl-sn-glycerol-3-phosphate acyltransferase [Candidatus Rokubacteria bacterium]|nr:1-acyl-sn-glycerol-3-phosphate acyltransferase [Candidatus Rokubacteria bacterium]